MPVPPPPSPECNEVFYLNIIRVKYSYIDKMGLGAITVVARVTSKFSGRLPDPVTLGVEHT